MKMRKVISFATAAVLSIASLPILSVGAVDSTNYLLGDLDGDGRITGHDSAMLSNVMYNSYAKPLSEMQQFLADMDGNGEITVEDLNAIHAKEEAKIACVKYDDSQETGFSYANEPTIDAAYLAICVEAYTAIEYHRNVCKEEDFPEAGKNQAIYVDRPAKQFYISEELLVLLDANGDGRVSLEDAYCIMVSNARLNCNLGGMYPSENRYDLNGAISTEEQKQLSKMETVYSGMTSDEFHDYIDSLFENYIDPNGDLGWDN